MGGRGPGRQGGGGVGHSYLETNEDVENCLDWEPANQPYWMNPEFALETIPTTFRSFSNGEMPNAQKKYNKLVLEIKGAPSINPIFF